MLPYEIVVHVINEVITYIFEGETHRTYMSQGNHTKLYNTLN